MSTCINTTSAEFSALKKRTGLSDFQLKVGVRAYQSEHDGKWPHLDELPQVNSEESLKQILKVNNNNSAKVSDILEATNTGSVEEATVSINNIHRDLNTTILPLNEKAIVNIEQRPSPFRVVRGNARDLSYVNSPVFIGQALENLGQNFGIQTVYKTTKELQQMGVLDQVPEGVGVSAFILDGNIVVNSDVASVDAPVHELMHVLLGSLKYTNPDLYFNLVQTSRQLSTYGERAALYPHRGQSDVDEEVFVQEYARYLSGLQSDFSKLDPEILYQLDYEVSRTLDTILNGDNSVRLIPQALRFGSSLKTLGVMVNSKNMESRFQGFADSAFLNRVMGNIKSDLFKQNKLEEIC